MKEQTAVEPPAGQHEQREVDEGSENVNGDYNGNSFITENCLRKTESTEDGQ